MHYWDASSLNQPFQGRLYKEVGKKRTFPKQCASPKKKRPGWPESISAHLTVRLKPMSYFAIPPQSVAPVLVAQVNQSLPPSLPSSRSHPIPLT